MATTLVTFLFDCPVPARSVELLGSWDNFRTPYSLKQDRKRGPRFWSGCFTFQDIFCDGDPRNLGPRRTGALKVGGTYWYYYKVDDDEEIHNPREPSTTRCPLLPGQRLNILEVPMESGSQGHSQSSDVFTRNPDDRYLTPVPPRPFLSPRLGDLCIQPYTVPTLTDGTPRSATYPGATPSSPYSLNQRSKSASTSPLLGNAASFMDLRALKQKVTNAKGTPSHPQPRNAKELQIGAPILISTTAEDMMLVPLPPRTTPVSSSLPDHIAKRLREFSPLGSHPVNLVKDPLHGQYHDSEETITTRRRSQSQPTNAHIADVTPGRERANSADTRRTRHYHIFSNEPWLNSPKVSSQEFGAVELDGRPAPVLRRPPLTITPPSTTAVERPRSRRVPGGARGLQATTPLDKELPALPRYLVPAPLFACSTVSPSPVLPDEKSSRLEPSQSDDQLSTVNPRQTDSSLQSAETEPSGVGSDRSTDPSPTSSSFTINSSASYSPQRHSRAFTAYEQEDYMLGHSPTHETARSSETDSASPSPVDVSQAPFLTTPHLSIPPTTDDQTKNEPDSKRRRRYGYSGIHMHTPILPESEHQSQITLASTFSLPVVASLSDRGTSVGLFEEMVSEFGFLGEPVR